MRTLVGKTPRCQAGPEPWPGRLWSLDGVALKSLLMHKGSFSAFQSKMAVAPDLASPELISSAFQGERGKPGLPGEKGEAGDPVSIGYCLHEDGDRGGEA